MARGRKDVSDVIRGRHVWGVKVDCKAKHEVYGIVMPQTLKLLVTTNVKDLDVAKQRAKQYLARNRRFRECFIHNIEYRGTIDC